MPPLIRLKTGRVWVTKPAQPAPAAPGAGYAPSADVLKNIVPPPPAVTLQSTGPVPPPVPPREAAAGAESGRATSSSAGWVVRKEGEGSS